MIVHGSIVDFSCVEMLEVGIGLPVREMSLEIEQILIESFKFGVKVMYDVSSVEVCKWGRMIFFVVGGRVKRSWGCR